MGAGDQDKSGCSDNNRILHIRLFTNINFLHIVYLMCAFRIPDVSVDPQLLSLVME
jgi:hypothetical protein